MLVDRLCFMYLNVWEGVKLDVCIIDKSCKNVLG